MMEIEIRQITTQDPAYKELIQLRNRILREPLGLSLMNEDLTRDADDKILTAYHDDKMVGCVMLKPLNEKEIKLRAMAVDTDFQLKGIGKMLVENAEDVARKNGYETIVLHARVVAKEFYAQQGYDAVSDEFIEVTVPHIAMQKHIG